MEWLDHTQVLKPREGHVVELRSTRTLWSEEVEEIERQWDGIALRNNRLKEVDMLLLEGGFGIGVAGMDRQK